MPSQRAFATRPFRIPDTDNDQFFTAPGAMAREKEPGLRFGRWPRRDEALEAANQPLALQRRLRSAHGAERLKPMSCGCVVAHIT